MYFCNTPVIFCDIQFFAMRDGYRAAALANLGSDLHTHRNGREIAGAFSGARLCVVCHRIYLLPFTKGRGFQTPCVLN